MADNPPEGPQNSNDKPTDVSKTSGSASDNGLLGNESLSPIDNSNNDTKDGRSEHEEQDVTVDDHNGNNIHTPNTQDLTHQDGSISADIDQTLQRPYAPRRNSWIHCYYCDWEGEKRPAYTIFGCEHIMKFGGETICFVCLNDAKNPNHRHNRCPPSSRAKERSNHLLAGVPLPSSPLPIYVHVPEVANGSSRPEDSKRVPTPAVGDVPVDESTDTASRPRTDIPAPHSAKQGFGGSETIQTKPEPSNITILGSWALDDDDDDDWSGPLYNAKPRVDRVAELVTQTDPKAGAETVEKNQGGEGMSRIEIPTIPGLSRHDPVAAPPTAATGFDVEGIDPENEKSDEEDGSTDSIDSIYGETSKDGQKTEAEGQTLRSGSIAVSHWSESSSEFEEHPFPTPTDENEVRPGGVDGHDDDDHNLIDQDSLRRRSFGNEAQATSENGDDDDTPSLLLRRRSFPMSTASGQAQPSKRRLRLLRSSYEREMAQSRQLYWRISETLRREQEAAEDLAADLRQWQHWASERFEGAQNVEQANQTYEAEVADSLQVLERSQERAVAASKLAADRDKFFQHLTREVKADPPITDYAAAESLLHQNNLTISTKHLATELKNKERYRNQRNAAEQKLEAAEEEIRQNQDQIRHWKEHLKRASEQIDELQEDTRGSTQEINGLRDMMDSYKAEADGLKRTEQDLRKEIASLKAELASETSKDHCKDEKDEIVRLQATVTERDATIQDLEEQVDVLTSAAWTEPAEGTGEPCKAEKEQIERMQATLNDRDATVEELKERLEVVSLVSETSESFVSTESEWEQYKVERGKIKQLHNTLDEREGQLKDAQAMLENVVTVHQNEMDEMNEKLRSKEIELAEARGMNQDLNTMYETQLRDLEQKNAELQAVVGKDEKKQGETSEMETLREGNQLLQQTVNRLTDDQQEQEEIKKRLGALEYDNAKLLAERDSLKDHGREEWKELQRLRTANEAMEAQDKRVCYEFATGHNAKIKRLETLSKDLKAKMEKLKAGSNAETADQGTQAGVVSFQSRRFATLAVQQTAPKRYTTDSQGTQTSLIMGPSAPTDSTPQVDRTSAHYLERLNFWKTCTPAQAQQQTATMAQNLRSVTQTFFARQRQMASILSSCQQRSQECMRIIRESRAVSSAYTP